MVEDMKVRKGYKKTEIGVIPEDWECMKLENVLNSVQLGGNYKNSENKTSFPLIKMGNLDRGRIKLTKIEYVDNTIIPSERDKLKYGDVLLNTRNTPELVGKTSIWRNELSQAYFNLNILRFNFDNSYISSTFFMNYILNTNQSIEQLRDFATGTTSVAAIYTRDLMNLKIAIPPLEEQKTIAKALTDTDNLIYSIEKVIDKKEKIKQGTMQELLTGKKRLDEFSGEWEVRQLGELSRMQSGGTPLTSNQKYYGGNIPWVSIKDMTSSNKYLMETEKRLTDKGLMNSSAVLFDKNTVLYAMYASIGECVIANDRVSSSQAILGIQCFSILDIEYLYYYLTLIKDKMIIQGQTGTQSNLNKKMVQKTIIKIPETIAEQKAISQILSDMDQEIQGLKEKLEKHKTIKQAMMQELLTGRIRLI